MRCEDLPPVDRAKQKWHRVLMIIPPIKTDTGKLRTPELLDAYLLPLLREAQLLGPPLPGEGAAWGPAGLHFDHPSSLMREECGQGMLIKPCYREPGTGKVVSYPADKEFTHHVVIVCVYADTPARVKLQRSVGHASFLACPYCNMSACSVGRHRLMLGYHKPATMERGVLSGRQCQMIVDDALLLRSSEVNVHRALAYERYLAECKRAQVAPMDTGFWGVKGLSLLSRFLWWTDYNRLFVVPIHHAFHRGIFRDFLLAICGSSHTSKVEGRLQDNGEGGVRAGEDGYGPMAMPNGVKLQPASRRIIEARSQRFVVTQDFNRGVRPVLNYCADFVIEELVRMLDPALCLLMNEAVEADGIIEQAFGLLRTVHLHHCTHHEWESEEARAAAGDDALEALIGYARMCEQRLGLAFCTSNLHLLVCQLRIQEQDLGDTAYFNEMWVERMMKRVKRLTWNGSRSRPEEVVVNDLELCMAMDILQATSPIPLDQDVDHNVHGLRYPDDVRGDPGGTTFLGAGRPYGLPNDAPLFSENNAGVLDEIREKIVVLNSDNDVVAGWVPDYLRPDNLHRLEVTVYDKVLLRGSEVVTSRSYTASQERDSSHVLCSFEGGRGREEIWVGVVEKYLRISVKDSGVPPLRVAILSLYNYKRSQCPRVSDAIGDVWRVRLGQFQFQHTGYPVLAEEIACKVVYADHVLNGANYRYLAKYHFSSKLL